MARHEPPQRSADTGGVRHAPFNFVRAAAGAHLRREPRGHAADAFEMGRFRQAKGRAHEVRTTAAQARPVNIYNVVPPPLLAVVVEAVGRRRAHLLARVRPAPPCDRRTQHGEGHHGECASRARATASRRLARLRRGRRATFPLLLAHASHETVLIHVSSSRPTRTDAARRPGGETTGASMAAPGPCHSPCLSSQSVASVAWLDSTPGDFRRAMRQRSLASLAASHSLPALRQPRNRREAVDHGLPCGK